MKVNLKDGIRNIAEADGPSTVELQRLRALVAEATEKPGGLGKRLARTQTWLATSAALLALLAVSFWLAVPGTAPNRAAQLADEIARNHVAAKALDVEAHTIAQLREPLASLGFAIRDLPPGRAVGHLEGGRFCSVQTVPAALLRYRVEPGSGAHVTVYQAAYMPKRHGWLPDLDGGEQPVVARARGVVVEIWTSGGLLFATARDEHQPSEH